MRRTSLVLLLLIIISVTGCSGGNGPSEKLAEEILYGVYLADVDIEEKTSCELTPGMESGGHTNVWFIRYRFKKSGDDGGILITEVDGEWQPYLIAQDGCPE